jgi:hypothetical protein
VEGNWNPSELLLFLLNTPSTIDNFGKRLGDRIFYKELGPLFLVNSVFSLEGEKISEEMSTIREERKSPTLIEEEIDST